MEGHQWRVVAGGQCARYEWNQVRNKTAGKDYPSVGLGYRKQRVKHRLFFFLLMVILQVVYKAR